MSRLSDSLDLRDYQLRAKDEINARLASGQRRLAVVSPTGSGKTVLFSSMIADAVACGDRALVIVHRRELISQAVDKLRRFGIEPGVILAGVNPMPSRPVQVASVQTLAKRALPRADWVIIDEAHHATAPSWRRIIDSYTQAAILGFTATPWPAGGKGLEDLFDGLVVAATVSELIRAGALVEYDAFAYDSPKLDDVPLVAGEFNQAKLALAANTKVLVGQVVREYLRYGDRRRALLFPVSIEHSLSLVAEFRIHGVPAEHIDGETKPDVRARILERLSSGEVLVVSSVGVLTEGFDSPAVEVCILARPTMSIVLAIQMMGRVLRPSPGKRRALIVDHAGNLLRHGLPDEEREYSLTKTPERIAELNTCPLCRAVFARLLDDGSCPKCGQIVGAPREEREAAARRKKQQIEGERIAAEEIKRRREAAKKKRAADPLQKEKKAYLGRLFGEAKRAGRPKAWVWQQYFRRYPKYAPEPEPEGCTCFLGHPPCSWCTRDVQDGAA